MHLLLLILNQSDSIGLQESNNGSIKDKTIPSFIEIFGYLVRYILHNQRDLKKDENVILLYILFIENPKFKILCLSRTDPDTMVLMR